MCISSYSAAPETDKVCYESHRTNVVTTCTDKGEIISEGNGALHDILTNSFPKCTRKSVSFRSNLAHGDIMGLDFNCGNVTSISPLVSEWFSEVSLRRLFGRQNWYIYSAKTFKSIMWFSTQWTRYFTLNIHFVTLNHLDRMTLKSCFLWSRVSPGAPLISDFYPAI